MIIQFTIGNFLSFKEQSTLSLAASALKEIQVPAEDIIFSVGTAGLLLMKSAVVYGANASVSYTHLTLPTKRIVEILVVAVSLKKKKKKKKKRIR